MKPLPQRKSPRLQGYDYSSEGMYFVTICTFQRNLIFGDVIDGKMKFDKLGEIAYWHWHDLPNHFPSVILDMMVVMPNHIHGIIAINHDRNETVGMRSIASAEYKQATLGTIVGTFKAAVTRKAKRTINFTDRIWQSSYHDHIIRKEERLNHIRLYVLYNPAKWEEDKFYRETS